MATVTTPAIINVIVATKLLFESLDKPHTPWPDVHPLPSRVPNPTSKPATMACPNPKWSKL